MVEVNPGSVDAGQDTAPGQTDGGGNFRKKGQTQITENRSGSAFIFVSMFYAIRMSIFGVALLKRSRCIRVTARV